MRVESVYCMQKFFPLAMSFTVIVSISFLITNNLSPVTAQDNKDSSVKFLFIQSAMNGSLVPDHKNNSGDGNGTLVLTLNNISSQTIAFSDRPQRVLKEFDTPAFVDKWGAKKESFAADPPNAALVINQATQNQEDRHGVIVIELLNPVFSNGNNTLTYDAKSLDIAGEHGEDVVFSEIGNKTTNYSSVPGSFGQVTLIIDAGSCTWWDPRC